MGSPQYLTDTALNDSNKALTVPANRKYKIMGGLAQLVSTATVGNRQIELRITDGTNTVFAITANGTQAASLTRQYHFILGTDGPSAVAGTVFVCPIPPGLWLPPTWTIQVLDTAAIDAAADDLTLRFLVEEEYGPAA
jgi:hypothetical protein